MNFNKSSNLNVKDFPVAFFCDNKKATALRNELIKNQVRISECEQGYLEHVFFSKENIDLINKQLILSVFKNSNKTIKIESQDENSLIIVMRYVFLEYARHLPYNITEQIRELNCKVVGEILGNVITNTTQKINYLEEIQNPRKLIPLPVNVNKNKNILNYPL